MNQSNQNVNSTQSNQVQISYEELFSNYAERLEKGHITWETSPQGTAIATVHRLVNEAILNPPLQIEFSSQQIGKIENSAQRRVLDLQDNIFDLQSQIETIRREVENGWIAAIKADVAKNEQQK